MRSAHETPQFSIRCPKPILEKIQAIIDAHQKQYLKEHGYAPSYAMRSRTDVVIELLKEAFAAREAAALSPRKPSADLSPREALDASPTGRPVSPKSEATRALEDARRSRDAKNARRAATVRKPRAPVTRRKLAPAPRKKAAKGKSRRKGR
jgi:hypothetical protein